MNKMLHIEWIDVSKQNVNYIESIKCNINTDEL